MCCSTVLLLESVYDNTIAFFYNLWWGEAVTNVWYEVKLNVCKDHYIIWLHFTTLTFVPPKTSKMFVCMNQSLPESAHDSWTWRGETSCFPFSCFLFRKVCGNWFLNFLTDWWIVQWQATYTVFLTCFCTNVQVLWQKTTRLWYHNLVVISPLHYVLNFFFPFTRRKGMYSEHFPYLTSLNQLFYLVHTTGGALAYKNLAYLLFLAGFLKNADLIHDRS